LIRKLSPVLRGWAHYHRHIVPKRIFGRVDYFISRMIWRWIGRQHPNQSCGWIQHRSFSASATGSFAVRIQDQQGQKRVPSLYRAGRTLVERHIKVRADANPYDPAHTEYFEKRRCFAGRTYPVGKARAFCVGQG
jgi:RNA-directed DNA polymerase